MRRQNHFRLGCAVAAGILLAGAAHEAGAQEALAKDEAFAKLYAHTATFAELTGRNIAVGIDL